jgi:hypothetical protein
MIKIEKNTEVESNINYITCESGEFNDTDLVKCRLKTKLSENTVMFLVSQIKNTTNESSI